MTRHQKDEEDEGYWMKYTTWMTFADEILRSHRLASETGGTCELLRRDKKTKKKRKTTTCDGEEDEDEAHVVVVSFRLDFELSGRFWLCRWQQLVLYDPFLQQRSNPVPHHRCVLVFGTGLLQMM